MILFCTHGTEIKQSVKFKLCDSMWVTQLQEISWKHNVYQHFGKQALVKYK